MNAQALYQAGRLDEAIQALVASLRDDPGNVRQRTFLFELLCFAGDYDRAEKHLDMIAGSSREADLGALLYRSALHAERTRRDMFLAGARPQGAAPTEAVTGVLNGRSFASITDADPRIGARLEVFVAGQYTWLPFEHVSSLMIGEPKRLRDLLWLPARITAGPKFSDLELGEVLIPALYPLSYQVDDDEIRLGRATDWQEQPDGTMVPVGERLLQVGDDLIAIAEVRELEIAPAPTPA